MTRTAMKPTTTPKTSVGSERRQKPRTGPSFKSRRGEKLVDGLTKPELLKKYEHKVRLESRAMSSRWPHLADIDDLISTGFIGLMDAADRFDADRGVKFETYAGYRIRGAMLDELRREDWVPRSARSRAKQLESAFELLEDEQKRKPTEQEVSKHLGVSVERVRKLRRESASLSLVNFDAVAAQAEQEELVRTQPGSPSRSPDLIDELSRKDARGIIEHAMVNLTDDERVVIACYYFRGLNLSEIGQILTVSESRVSQLHSRALRRLRDNLKNEVGNATEVLQMLFE